MDDRRFDSLVKALATGRSRRSVFKGLFGLGGAALGGSVLLEPAADAARRPTPTPKPPSCPGRQIPSPSGCVCPTGLSKCGPDCCNDGGIPDTPNYSECCDGACCYGHCYGEELCCEYPLVFCEAQNECCGPDQNQCCGSMGCCDHECCQVAGGAGACCEAPNAKCCAGDACIPEDGCCSDDECAGGCQHCIDHVCTDVRADCAGGTAGCFDCVGGDCQKNVAYCNDDDACTSDVCDDSGICSNPFYCTSDACCNGNSAGPACNTQTGACFNPCVDTELASCEDAPCCSGMTCFSILDSPEVCITCIPSFVEDVPVPCFGFCDVCCSGMSYLGFCVDCAPPFLSCEDDPNVCCSGLCCQYNPFGDNFCSLACI